MNTLKLTEFALKDWFSKLIKLKLSIESLKLKLFQLLKLSTVSLYKFVDAIDGVKGKFDGTSM